MATTLQPSKDKIVDDLKSLISDAEELLKLTADQQGGKLDDLRARINGRVAVAKDRLADAEAAIVDTGKKAVRATSLSVVMSMVEIEPSNLLSTYTRLRASSTTTPVGPSPTSMGSATVRAPLLLMVMTLLEPMPVT